MARPWRPLASRSPRSIATSCSAPISRRRPPRLRRDMTNFKYQRLPPGWFREIRPPSPGRRDNANRLVALARTSRPHVAQRQQHLRHPHHSLTPDGGPSSASSPSWPRQLTVMFTKNSFLNKNSKAANIYESVAPRRHRPYRLDGAIWNMPRASADASTRRPESPPPRLHLPHLSHRR